MHKINSFYSFLILFFICFSIFRSRVWQVNHFGDLSVKLIHFCFSMDTFRNLCFSPAHIRVQRTLLHNRFYSLKSCSNKAPGSIPSLSYKTQILELTYAVQVTPITNSRSVNPYESTCSICLKACRAGAKETGSTTRDRGLPGDSPE